jgi:hypothetical protein
MNTCTWNYIGQSGIVALITLQHNTRNGDMVVYYNQEIVWAERGVRKPQVITFFIDDELCKIHIEFKDLNLVYFFEIDKKAKTALNKLRRNAERKDFGKGIAVLLAIAAGFGILLAAGWSYNRYADAKALAKNGIMVRAILEINPELQKNNCTYSFDFSGVPCVNYTHLDTRGDSVMLPYGLPARTGDVVLLRFDPTEIHNQQVYWEPLAEAQETRLCDRIREAYLRENPQLNYQIADCYVKTVYKLAGAYGLANIYYRNTPITQNWQHNELTFALMQHRFDYIDDVTECR